MVWRRAECHRRRAPSGEAVGHLLQHSAQLVLREPLAANHDPGTLLHVGDILERVGIEEQEIRPIGAEQTVPVDVRVVSATHCDLRQAMERETFRRDLFYRLNTVTIYVPPLRRRRVDIPFLAQHFTEELGEMHARRITLGEDFVDRLLQHDFPGNVRELRNAVEGAIALARPGETVTAEQLVGFATEPGLRPVEAGPAPREMDSYGADESLRSRVQKVELETIAQALERHDGNRTRVAEALGLSRVGLRQKMRRLGIDTPRRY